VGLTAGELTRAVGEHDLAIGFGDGGSVGIGGITLGGGIGYLVRKFGSRRRGPRPGSRCLYGPTWDRLGDVKRRWDPTNLFRLNQNVPPDRRAA
jgi:berberine-like enzyme